MRGRGYRGSILVNLAVVFVVVGLFGGPVAGLAKDTLGDIAGQPEASSLRSTLAVGPQLYLPLAVRSFQAPVRDDFSDPLSGWTVGEDGFSRLGYVSGEYRIVVKQADWLAGATRGISAGDFRIEVDGRSIGETGGGHGFYFGSVEAGYYVFQVFDNRPSYNYRLRRLDSNTGTWTVLTGGSSAAVRPWGQTNRVKVVRVGSTISAYANGTLVAQVSDSTYGAGYLGLVATGYVANYEARFDNFLAVFTPSEINAQSLPATPNSTGPGVGGPPFEELRPGTADLPWQ